MWTLGMRLRNWISPTNYASFPLVSMHWWGHLLTFEYRNALSKIWAIRYHTYCLTSPRGRMAFFSLQATRWFSVSCWENSIPTLWGAGGALCQMVPTTSPGEHRTWVSGKFPPHTSGREWSPLRMVLRGKRAHGNKGLTLVMCMG